MPEGERVNVYLPFTLAKAIRDARETGRPFNLSEAAARGIAQALHGSGPGEQLDPQQLDRIEKMVAELHQDQRQDQDDRSGWSSWDWIKADWPKAAAVAGGLVLLHSGIPA
jgi:hypothetical protein